MTARPTKPATLALRLDHPLRGAGAIGSLTELPPLRPPPPPAPTGPDYAALLRDAERQLKAVTHTHDQITAELTRARAAWQADADGRLDEARELAVELAVAIAAQFVHRQVERGEFPFEALAREMIGPATAAGSVTVHLHPDDLTSLRNRTGEDSTDVPFVSDPLLSRGDCRVETGQSVLLSDLSERLAAVRVQLLRSLGHAGD